MNLRYKLKFLYVFGVSLTYLVMFYTSSTVYLDFLGNFSEYFCLILELIWLVGEVSQGNYENLFWALEFFPEAMLYPEEMFLIKAGFFYFGIYLYIKYIFELIVYFAQ